MWSEQNDLRLLLSPLRAAVPATLPRGKTGMKMNEWKTKKSKCSTSACLAFQECHLAGAAQRAVRSMFVRFCCPNHDQHDVKENKKEGNLFSQERHDIKFVSLSSRGVVLKKKCGNAPKKLAIFNITSNSFTHLHYTTNGNNKFVCEHVGTRSCPSTLLLSSKETMHYCDVDFYGYKAIL